MYVLVYINVRLYSTKGLMEGCYGNYGDVVNKKKLCQSI